MGAHIIDGEFQSDKYPTTPRGKVPLSVKDVAAQDLLWEYAQRHRPIDSEFSDDLEVALGSAGFKPKSVSPEDMLITLANMALKMSDLTGHDVIEAIRELGYGHIVARARDLK